MVAGVNRSSTATGVALGAREALGLGDLGGGHVFVKFVAVKNCETRWRNVHVAEKDVEDVTSRSVNAANVRFSPFCVRCTSGSRGPSGMAGRNRHRAGDVRRAAS